MGEWIALLQGGDPALAPPLEAMLLALLLAFVIGQVIAWVYMTTHTTLSYSSSFVASLVMLPVLVALMMVLMSGSVVVAFGLVAVFAVVRFRNVLRDTRDTVYVMWAVVQGMATGTFRFSTAVLGALCVSLALLYLWITCFGQRSRFDAALSLLIKQDSRDSRQRIQQVLHRHADRVTLTGERVSPDARSTLNYRLLLRNPLRHDELRAELAGTGDVQDVTFYLQEDDGET